jgi:hypothetical protein
MERCRKHCTIFFTQCEKKKKVKFGVDTHTHIYMYIFCITYNTCLHFYTLCIDTSLHSFVADAKLFLQTLILCRDIYHSFVEYADQRNGLQIKGLCLNNLHLMLFAILVA